MDWNTIGIWIGAILTLFMFSFLYKENPFYRFGEHLVIGVSVGLGFVYEILRAFVPTVWTPFLKPLLTFKFNSPEMHWWIIIPFSIGLLWLTRFSREYSWLSRYPMAIGIGLGTGMSLPLSIKASILVQLRSTMVPLINFQQAGGINWMGTINSLITFFGVIMVLLYFYFSKAHTGTYGKFTKGGIWILMISFGASFGYTVMARISLLIGRLQFLFGDWLHLIK